MNQIQIQPKFFNQIQFPTILDEPNSDSTHIFEPDSVCNHTWLTKFRFNPNLINQIQS